MKKYWIACISKNHSEIAVAENIIQVCHGKKSPLTRMSKGDFLVIYSAKKEINGVEKVQEFTAFGRVDDELIYQVQMNENFKPFRRKVTFFESENTSILPLIHRLDFIPNKQSWGFPFRFGFLEIPSSDFIQIADAMKVDLNSISSDNFVE